MHCKAESSSVFSPFESPDIVICRIVTTLVSLCQQGLIQKKIVVNVQIRTLALLAVKLPDLLRTSGAWK